MGSEPMQVTHTPRSGGAAPGVPVPGGTTLPDAPLGHPLPSGAGTPADLAGTPADPDDPPGHRDRHHPDALPRPDMPAAAALYQLAAARGGRGDLAAISAESGLGEERAAAGWRTLAGLALVRIRAGQVETLGSDAALDAIVGRYASYAFEALRSVRAVNDTTRKLLTVFGCGAPGPGGVPAVLPFTGAAYTPYDDCDASEAGRPPWHDDEPGERTGDTTGSTTGDATADVTGTTTADVTGGIPGSTCGEVPGSHRGDACDSGGDGRERTAEVPCAAAESVSTAGQEPYRVRESAAIREQPRTGGARTGLGHREPAHHDRDRHVGVRRGSERPGPGLAARERGRGRRGLALSWESGAGPAAAPAPGSTVTRGQESVLRTLTESTLLCADSLHGGALPGDPAVLEAYLEMTARLVLRGVRVRALCTPTTLSTPGGTRYARDIAAAGAHVRVVDRVGHGMLICDGHTVCLPDTECGDPADPAVLCVTNPQLARTFLAVYEAYWQRAALFLPDGPHAAAPAAGTGGCGVGAYETGADHGDRTGGGTDDERERLTPVPQLGSFEQAVVRLMAGGRSDADIARELGVDAGAVGEVMASLMRRLGAATRFEAGLRLARVLDDGPLPWSRPPAGPYESPYGHRTPEDS